LQIPKFATRSSAKFAIGFRSHEEIRLRKTIDLVRPDLDRAPSPPDVQVWVMTLLLGDSTHPIRERHGGGEIAELVRSKHGPGSRVAPAGLELL
jgi:hypothetical protein